MNKLFKNLIVLLLIYVLLNFIVGYFSKGHNLSYTIIKKQMQINIDETYKKATSTAGDSYLIKVNLEKEKFIIQILNDYDGDKKILKDVQYFKDKDYKCILPIFKSDKILTDITCKDKAGIYYNYKDISDKSDTLKEKADEMIKYGYSKIKYQDNKNREENKGLIKLYTYNSNDDLAFAITNYKGLLYLKNDKLNSVELFNNDIYIRGLSEFVDNYYVTADYNQKYDFDKFYIVDIRDGKVDELNLSVPIASDSYIAGVVGSDIYIIDKSAKKQYCFSVKDKTFKEVGNESKGMIFYKDNKSEIVPYSRMTLKNTYFSKFKPIKEGKYTLFLKSNNPSYGYNYYFKLIKDEYHIYRSINGYDDKKYLFKTKSIDKMRSADDYIFYQTKTEIKYYSDATGVRTLLSDSELEFNKNILYGAYEK